MRVQDDPERLFLAQRVVEGVVGLDGHVRGARAHLEARLDLAAETARGPQAQTDAAALALGLAGAMRVQLRAQADVAAELPGVGRRRRRGLRDRQSDEQREHEERVQRAESLPDLSGNSPSRPSPGVITEVLSRHRIQP